MEWWRHHSITQKCYWNGEGPNSTTIVVVVRDHQRGVRQIVATGITLCSPEEAEVNVILLGVRVSCSEEMRSTVISDSKCSVQWITDLQATLPWRFEHYIKDCRRLIQSKGHVVVKFSRRQANEGVHRVAQICNSLSIHGSWTPTCLPSPFIEVLGQSNCSQCQN